ncbi:MAG: methyl-accepting chemotaxis protein [Planctomycetaceae bacterium]|jgi:methyl-accepting chemotaxis protein|nr:methyl-accepting chemotaxis protein [Planctomycetaceae bacterium]
MMKISNFKLSTQLIIVLSLMTLFLSILYFGLIFYGQWTTETVFDESMKSTKSALDASKQKLEKELADNLSEVNKDVRSTVQTLSTDLIANLARQVGAEISLSVEGAIGQTRNFADTVKIYMKETPKEQLDRAFLIKFLGELTSHPDFCGASICFEPNVFDGKDDQFKGKTELGCDDAGRFIPWAYIKDGKVCFEPLDQPDTSDYYTEARDTKKEYVTPPYDYLGIIMITVAVPVLDGDKLLAVVTTDLEVLRLENILKQYKPFNNGFAFLVDESGVIVWHPYKDFILKNLTELEGREKLVECVRNNKFSQTTVLDLKTKKEMFQTYVPVKFGVCPKLWGVIVSAVVDDVMQAAKETGNKIDTLDKSVNGHIDTLVSGIDEANKTAEDKMTENNQKSTVRVIVASLAIILLSVVLAFFVGHSFSAPIIRSVAVLHSIAVEGDLSVEVPHEIETRGDEIGKVGQGIKQILDDYRLTGSRLQRLAEGDWTDTIQAKGANDTLNHNFALMCDQVNKTLHEISERVSQVATGASEVSNAAETLSSGAQESAASLEEITASMSEISGQTKTNAEGATTARDIAQKATKAAAEGQEAMRNMNASMERITKNSGEIQRVIKVIDDIAFQTNLLALNAAVEAARAGAHGKGFAVVAEEVRNLASRSAKAAQETSALIITSGQEIQRGGEVANHTGEVLNTIVEQITQTTGLISEIAKASNEQAQGVNQVTVGLQQIDTVTQQNTASAEESASAINEMKSTAANLQQLVAQFKLRK